MNYVDRRLAELGGKRPRDRIIGEPLPKRVPNPKYPGGTLEKPCTRCKIVKPLSDFSEAKYGALGRQSKCKACICLIGKEWTKKNREAKATRPRPDNCECCGAFNKPGRALHWDHCHGTKEFRGWLCSGCNTALGHVDDSVERLEMLITYLKNGGPSLKT